LEPYGKNGRKELRSHADIVLPPPARDVWENLNAAHEAKVAAKAK
jgi:hypothetical protein